MTTISYTSFDPVSNTATFTVAGGWLDGLAFDGEVTRPISANWNEAHATISEHIAAIADGLLIEYSAAPAVIDPADLPQAGAVLAQQNNE